MFLRNVGIALQIHTAPKPKTSTTTRFVCLKLRVSVVAYRGQHFEICHTRVKIKSQLFYCSRYTDQSHIWTSQFKRTVSAVRVFCC
jgi:hypothetical protein